MKTSETDKELERLLETWSRRKPLKEFPGVKVEEAFETKTEVVKIPLQKITFSREAVEKILLQELQSRGYHVEEAKVYFENSRSYVYDEWGMNSTVVTKFDGAIIELPGGSENHGTKR